MGCCWLAVSHCRLLYQTVPTSAQSGTARSQPSVNMKTCKFLGQTQRAQNQALLHCAACTCLLLCKLPHRHFAAGIWTWLSCAKLTSVAPAALCCMHPPSSCLNNTAAALQVIESSRQEGVSIHQAQQVMEANLSAGLNHPNIVNTYRHATMEVKVRSLGIRTLTAAHLQKTADAFPARHQCDFWCWVPIQSSAASSSLTRRSAVGAAGSCFHCSARRPLLIIESCVSCPAEDA